MEFSKDTSEALLLNTVSDGLCIVNAQSEITFVNHAAMSMLGHGKQSLIGQTFEKVLVMQLNGQEVTPDASPLKNTMRTKTVYTSMRDAASRFTLARSDRSILPIHLTILPYSTLGNHEDVMVVFHDRTADEKIDQAKSEFIAMVSHQLRTPVNIISWYVEKLMNERRGELNDKQRDYMNEIYKSNKRVIDLVQAIVNVSRTDLTKLMHRHENVDALACAYKAINELQPYINQRNLKLTTRVEESNYSLHDSDQEFVKTIIKNVLLNAVRYSLEGGNIHFMMRSVAAGAVMDTQKDVRAKRNGIHISISDTGIGIPDEEKSRIFTKLFRASNVHALDVTGVGLGLYIALSFAQELGGNIWFDSELRRGSIFSIYLPSE